MIVNTNLYDQLKFTFSVFVVSYIEFFFGCTFVFSSILFAQLREPSSTIKLSTDEASWIASVPSLIGPLGLLIVGVLTDKIGRKTSLQVAYIPVIVSWLILSYANSYESILVGRTIMGLTFGSGACVYVYVAEICQPRRRQLFFAVLFGFSGVGMMTECMLAMFFHWHTVSAIFTVMSIAGLAMLSALPESPVWLRARGRHSEAEDAERWLDLEPGCGTPKAAAAAAVGGKDDTQNNNNNGSCCAEPDQTADDGAAVPSCWTVYTHRTVWMPTLITVAFLACQQGTGLYVLFFYSADVLRDFRVQWDGVVVSLFMSVSRVIGSVAFSLLHSVKRKTLAVVSCAGMAASLIAIITYMKTFENVNQPPFDFLLIVAFVAYMFFALVGAMPLPWTLCSEVFPRTVTGTMNGVVQTIAFLMMFAVIKMYPSLVSNFGIEIVWLIFTTICIASVFFCIFIMPETKGISLKDILASFEPRKNIIKNSKQIP